MSFEYSRRLGLAGTLVIVAVTVGAPIIVVAAFFSGWLRGGVMPSALLFSLLTFSGHILFLIAMRRFAGYYRSRGIFSNALYGVTVAIVGSLIFSVLSFGAFSFLSDYLESIPRTPTTPPSASIFLVFISFFLIVWVGAFLLAIVQGVFFRRAFYALGEKSGERNFREAGFFMFIGGILTIIAVGALLFFVGWIFALLGFHSLRPSAVQPSSFGRFCPVCGSENPKDAVFCVRCGNKL